jgi:ABC-type lipoprotein export system ATPase subunit
MKRSDEPSDRSEPQISVRGACKIYPREGAPFAAVDDVNLDVSRGHFVVVTGRSGAGKSTLLSLIGGLSGLSRGTIRVDGADLAALGDDGRAALRAKTIGFVFQFASLMPTLTVLDNVRLPSLFGVRVATPDRALELLDWVGLADRAEAYPSQLSGGQQRRVAIARALINGPAILLADEPTGDLDTDTEASVLSLFRELNRRGMTILLVTHNRDVASDGDRACRMECGRLLELEGETERGTR